MATHTHLEIQEHAERALANPELAEQIKESLEYFQSGGAGISLEELRASYAEHSER